MEAVAVDGARGSGVHARRVARAGAPSSGSPPDQLRSAILPNAEENGDPDLLGLFVGSALAEPEESPLPPQILLYLENIWDFAENDEQAFRKEIRTTYLHELGHYLGLDEIDLERRGLD